MTKKAFVQLSANRYNYENLASIRKLLRDFVKLETRAVTGNYDAVILLADVKTGMNKYRDQNMILTRRQNQCIDLCLIEDRTEREAANILGVSQQAIHYSLSSGVKRLQKYLITGEIRSVIFLKEEEVKLIELYNGGYKPSEIAKFLDKKVETVRNKIKYLKIKGRIGTEVSMNDKAKGSP